MRPKTCAFAKVNVHCTNCMLAASLYTTAVIHIDSKTKSALYIVLHRDVYKSFKLIFVVRLWLKLFLLFPVTPALAPDAAPPPLPAHAHT